MRKLLLLFALMSGIVWAQVPVKKETKELTRVIPKLDSSYNLKDYKNASQLLGLIEQQILVTPVSEQYLDKEKLKFPFVVTAREKTTLPNGYKLKANDQMRISYDDFYKDYIDGKYFTIDSIIFYDEYNGIKRVSPEVWDYNQKFGASFTKNNIDIFFSNEDNNWFYRLRAKGSEDLSGIIALPYFEYLKNNYTGKEFLSSLKNTRYIMLDENYYNHTQARIPEEVLDEDIVVFGELSLTTPASKYGRYLNLSFEIYNKTKPEQRMDTSIDYLGNLMLSLSEVEDYNMKRSILLNNREKLISDIKRLYNSEMAEKIIAGDIELGMNELAIMFILGAPDDKNETIYNDRKTTQFIYRISDDIVRYYYFENDKLIAIQK